MMKQDFFKKVKKIVQHGRVNCTIISKCCYLLVDKYIKSNSRISLPLPFPPQSNLSLPLPFIARGPRMPLCWFARNLMLDKYISVSWLKRIALTEWNNIQTWTKYSTLFIKEWELIFCKCSISIYGDKFSLILYRLTETADKVIFFCSFSISSFCLLYSSILIGSSLLYFQNSTIGSIFLIPSYEVNDVIVNDFLII